LQYQQELAKNKEKEMKKEVEELNKLAGNPPSTEEV
jgi:hypothetical protein